MLFLVTDQVTNNRRAAVRRLNSAHVSVLVGQPEITLDKLHKISNPCLDKNVHTTQAKNTNETEKDSIYTVSGIKLSVFAESK